MELSHSISLSPKCSNFGSNGNNFKTPPKEKRTDWLYSSYKLEKYNGNVLNRWKLGEDWLFFLWLSGKRVENQTAQVGHRRFLPSITTTIKGHNNSSIRFSKMKTNKCIFFHKLNANYHKMIIRLTKHIVATHKENGTSSGGLILNYVASKPD